MRRPSILANKPWPETTSVCLKTAYLLGSQLRSKPPGAEAKMNQEHSRNQASKRSKRTFISSNFSRFSVSGMLIFLISSTMEKNISPFLPSSHLQALPIFQLTIYVPSSNFQLIVPALPVLFPPRSTASAVAPLAGDPPQSAESAAKQRAE